MLIQLADILEYLGDRKRPLVEGEAVYNAGHVFFCGQAESETSFSSSANSYHILALCNSSSAVTAPPHEQDLKLHREVKNWRCYCSCKAGQSGYCKHVFAVLIFLNRNDSLEDVGCTDVKQAWGQQKKDLKIAYGTKRIGDFCHGCRPKKKIIAMSDSLKEENFNFLVSQNSQSALHRTVFGIASSINNLQQRTDASERYGGGTMTHLKVLEDHIMKSTLCILNISPDSFNLQNCCQTVLESLQSKHFIVDTCEQGSDTWKNLRQLRITGSRCYSIYTYKGENWSLKSEKYFWPKSFSSKYTNHGLKWEGKARDAYMSLLSDSEIYVPAFIISPELFWLGYSPDGVIFTKDKPTKLLEIKCPYSGVTDEPECFINTCDYLLITGDSITLKKTHAYYAQLQLGMSILQIETADLYLYSSKYNRGIIIAVEFDLEYSSNLINRVTENYFSHMLHHYCLNRTVNN